MDTDQEKKIDRITEEKLAKYFAITREAIAMIEEKGFASGKEDDAREVLSMAKNYLSDATTHFYPKQDFVNAFAAINYAHGWLDAGARLGLFLVHDSRLFTVDD